MFPEPELQESYPLELSNWTLYYDQLWFPVVSICCKEKFYFVLFFILFLCGVKAILNYGNKGKYFNAVRNYAV